MKASDVMKRLSSGEMISILKEIYSEKLDEQILRYKDASSPLLIILVIRIL